MSTRQIGTSTDLGINSHSGTLHEEITHQLGEHAGEHNIDAIEADYRYSIGIVLPNGVWLSGDTLYSDRDDDLELGFISNTLESIPASEDFWSIVEKHQQERVLTPIVIHEDSEETLRDASLGPRYSDAYYAAEEAGDTATCERIEREQVQLAGRLYTAWSAEAVRIGAERGYEVSVVGGNNDSRYNGCACPAETRTDLNGDGMGRTMEASIHQDAHDAAVVDGL